MSLVQLIGTLGFENDGNKIAYANQWLDNPSRTQPNPWFFKKSYRGHLAPISKGIDEKHFQITHYMTGY